MFDLCCCWEPAPTEHIEPRSCVADVPDVDMEKLNCAIDDMAEDIVGNYLNSKLYKSTTICRGLDRQVLSISTRHSIAILASLTTPYILPRFKEAISCQNRCELPKSPGVKSVNSVGDKNDDESDKGKADKSDKSDKYSHQEITF